MGGKRRSSLNKRYKQRCEDDKSTSFGFMRYPSGTKLYKPDEGEHNFLIVPYIIKTEKHPTVAKKRAEIGEDDYALTVDIHQNVGPNNISVVCLKNNYGKSCPLCEEGGEIAKVSTRAIYNIVNADRPERGLYIFSLSSFAFQEELVEELSAQTKGQEIIPFADPEEGYIISCRGAKQYFTGGSFIKFKSFKFRRRDKELDDMYADEQWHKKSISLDKCLIILSYDEIKSIYDPPYNEQDETDEAKQEQEQEQEQDDYEEKDNDREERRRKRRGKEKEENDEKDDCPYDFRFGVDTDTEKECEDCKKWKACDKKCRELERAKK
jgi:hypothetical protein